MEQIRASAFCLIIAIAGMVSGCDPQMSNSNANIAANQSSNSNTAASDEFSGNISTSGDPNETLSQETIDQGRNDEGWKKFVQIESDPSAAAAKNNESLKNLTAEAVNSGNMVLPLGNGEGPSVLRAQVLLDRSPFSPGIIDGMWGKNTEKAVYWMQKVNGLKATGKIDEATFKKLFELAGSPNDLVVEHKLTAEDVKGPFVDIPDDIYEQAKLDCMCYESLEEKLGEMFHASPQLLAQLNSGKKPGDMKAGDSILVPNVKEASESGTGTVDKLIISDGGSYVHAVDAGGKVLYHFPSTLGSKYAPSPTGEWKIRAIAPDPTWHYQPALLTGVPDDKPNAIIPAGPNNPVGKVWMDLSKEHYGIHGTKAPETIGYATSHGCVRLTNWDAVFLADKVRKGTAVSFTDTTGESGNQGNGSSED